MRVGCPRCPFCHDTIAPGAAQVACTACRAWHHDACWRERPRCSACGAAASRGAPDGVRGGFRFLYVVTIGVIALGAGGAAFWLAHAVQRPRFAMLGAGVAAAVAGWSWVLLLCRVTGLSLREFTDEVEGRRVDSASTHLRRRRKRSK